MIYLAIILCVLAMVYLLIGCVLHTGLGKRYQSIPGQPFVSVLVAARNEEKHLSACLDSLAGNSYPAERHEIIVIDDRSTDQTAEIANTYTTRYPHFKLLQIKAELNGLHAKMNALCQAVEQARGDIILITDADCRVGADWIAALTADFGPRTAIAGGLTLIESSGQKHKLFEKVQSLDLFFLLAVASGTAGVGLPVSILGNNFAFRKNDYEQIGGFRQMGFSLTEDMALMQHLMADRRKKIAYRLNQQTAVLTQPLQSFKEFLAQRKRWLQGGKKTTVWGFCLMTAAVMAHLSVILSILAGFWTTPLFLLTLVVLSVDISLVFRIARRVGKVWEIIYFPFFELFFTGYTLLLAFHLLRPSNIEWKGYKYRG